MEKPRIAIIGAGIAGLACARELSRADARVTVYERSRTLGGRLGTYRRGDFAFDHGAQYITARSRSFTSYVGVAGRAGAVQSWRPSIMEDDRAWQEPIDDWQVGTPGMSALIRPLSRSLDLRTGVTVHELVQSQRGWELQTDAGREDLIYDAIGVAVPAPQGDSLSINLIASSTDHGSLYGRLLVSASNTSAMATMRAETGIFLPANPLG